MKKDKEKDFREDVSMGGLREVARKVKEKLRAGDDNKALNLEKFANILLVRGISRETAKKPIGTLLSIQRLASRHADFVHCTPTQETIEEMAETLREIQDLATNIVEEKSYGKYDKLLKKNLKDLADESYFGKDVVDKAVEDYLNLEITRVLLHLLQW